jgi:Holliday junction resolvasome RuvABC endonuclease subunit
VVEVSPQEAKRRLTGNGKATKRQMVAAVRARFGVLVGQDAADAVGMALVAEGQAVMAALRGAK